MSDDRPPFRLRRIVFLVIGLLMAMAWPSCTGRRMLSRTERELGTGCSLRLGGVAARDASRATRALETRATRRVVPTPRWSAQLNASSPAALVEDAGRAAFEDVGQRAATLGIDPDRYLALFARYPDALSAAAEPARLMAYAHENPAFLRDLGKQIYFTSQKDWERLGGRVGLLGLGARLSPSFRREVEQESLRRFNEVAADLARDYHPRAGGLSPTGSARGVAISLHEGKVRMTLDTPLFLIDAEVPVHAIRKSALGAGAVGLGGVAGVKIVGIIEKGLAEASPSDDWEILRQLLGACLEEDLSGQETGLLQERLRAFQAKRGLSSTGRPDSRTLRLLTECSRTP